MTKGIPAILTDEFNYNFVEGVFPCPPDQTQCSPPPTSWNTICASLVALATFFD